MNEPNRSENFDEAVQAVKNGKVFIMTTTVIHDSKDRGTIAIAGGLRIHRGWDMFVACPDLFGSEEEPSEARDRHYFDIHTQLLNKLVAQINKDGFEKCIENGLENIGWLNASVVDSHYLYHQEFQPFDILKRSEIKSKLSSDLDSIFRVLDTCYEDDYPVLAVIANSLRKTPITQSSLSTH